MVRLTRAAIYIAVSAGFFWPAPAAAREMPAEYNEALPGGGRRRGAAPGVALDPFARWRSITG